MRIQRTVVSFPEINLATRDAHKLRGCIAGLFRKESPLLHNHLESGELNYGYPLVQYKVIDGVPYLVGLQEGAELLKQLFFHIREIDIEGMLFVVRQKDIDCSDTLLSVTDTQQFYKFTTHWMALNQKNYIDYILEKDALKRMQMLCRILNGNLLSLSKTLGYTVDRQLTARVDLTVKESKFKNKTMLVFNGMFSVNMMLPSMIGIGKAVSRGFGAIVNVKL